MRLGEQVNVREATVMGRAAVAVVVAFWQIPALAYLTGITGASVAISKLGDHAVALTWSGLFVVSGVLMLLVYRLQRPGDQARLELCVLLLFTVAMGVYLTAIYAAATTLDGRLAIIALLGSLIVNLVGRALLLIRQLWRERNATRRVNA